MERSALAVTDGITLGQFLKFAGVVGTGGHAKVLIEDGEVRVNGEVEQHRGRKLRSGDVVAALGREIAVAHRESSGPAASR
ncbi:MAG TPA: RNA-binding S4 domain-containing protein [Thermoleophilia bacterium]|nr:RNA-binding S4 domain-containing protein [Thermoleophilia bacterium]